MQKRYAITAFFLIIVIVVSAFVVMQSVFSDSPKPFHVGVTYCGNSPIEAKALIDKVKSYTNLFVLQSGPLQDNLTATTEICDYAVNNGLDIIVYYGSLSWRREVVSAFLNATENRWGEHFLGLYYGDEPGGNMLDAPQIILRDEQTGKGVSINQDTVTTRKDYATGISLSPSGVITLDTTIFYTRDIEPLEPISNTTTYYPNGTIVVTFVPASDTIIYQNDGTVTLRKQDGSASMVTDRGNISQFEPYQTLWASRPLQTYDNAATLFEANSKGALNWLRNQTTVKAFTSDYGLYWFDYKGGYDVVLAEFGWNHTTVQDIGLVRGAATMQNKAWGAMLTWKSNRPPYLASGQEMYEQMCLAYENGAQYVVVFNYSPDDFGVGLLRDEHFEALQRFWNEKAVPNSKLTKVVKAEVALVLPQNYGWGMRNPQDIIWGLWQADEKSPQVWTALQNALETYHTKLDIIYDDPKYPANQHYSHLYYWNQTS